MTVEQGKSLEEFRAEFEEYAQKSEVNGIRGKEEEVVHEREMRDAAEGKGYNEEF